MGRSCMRRGTGFALAIGVWLAQCTAAAAAEPAPQLGGPEPPGCAERAPETQESLRALVRNLQGHDDPRMMASWDRLRCAVHRHPQLALQLLLPLVGSGDRYAALAAAKIVGRIGPAASAAVPRLVIMLRSEDETSRIMAAQSLAKMGPAAEQAVDALIAALDDESPQVRRAAASTLAHIGPGAARAARPLAELLSDPHPQIRLSVLYAFQEIGYDGTMILDHSPKFTPDAGKGAATAYAIGYMRALLERALSQLSEEQADPNRDAA